MTNERSDNNRADPHSNVGRLELGSAGTRDSGKVIDTWEFQHPLKAQGKPYVVEVSFHKAWVPALGNRVMLLKATCSALPGGERSASDIETLKVIVERDLREQSILSSGVEWEDWLEVRVETEDRPDRREVAKNALAISYRVIKRGRHPTLEGQDYTINGGFVATPFPKAKPVGVETRDESQPLHRYGMEGFAPDGRDIGSAYSYIKDTPANRAALDGYVSALRLLGDRLAQHLNQANLTTALEAGGGPLQIGSAR